MKVIRGAFIDGDIPQLSEDGRRAAQGRSVDCPYCGGGGLVIVDAVSPHSRSKTAGATCTCVLGRWIRAWHQTNNRDLLESLPDLIQIMSGQERNWRFDDLIQEDDE